MRPIIVASTLILALFAVAHAQQPQAHQYMEEAEIRHQTTSAIVFANHPRPLWQAAASVREEYGWLVSFEEPPYQSAFDLFDATDPQWRTAHPGVRGALAPAGSAFQSEYPEGPTTGRSPDEEARVLGKVVSDYNLSGNPGKFTVRKQSDGSFAIIGISIKDDKGNEKSVGSVLDTSVTVMITARTPGGTVDAILQALSAASGVKVSLGSGPNNLMNSSQVTVGGTNIPARSLLLQTFGQMKNKMVWDLLYYYRTNTYYLSLSPAVRAQFDTFGRKRKVPVI